MTSKKMTENDLSQKVLEDIKGKKITARPKWEFIARDYLIWLLFVLSVFIGSLAMSVIIFVLRHNTLSKVLRQVPGSQVLFDLPYFWFVLLLIFILLAYYNFRQTKKGYKYNVYLVILASIFLSVLFGLIIYYVQVAEKLEQAFYRHVPIYRQLIDREGRMWLISEQGQIAGRIISPVSTRDEIIHFQLLAFDGKTWQVVSHNASLGSLPLEPGYRLILIGQTIGEKEFLANRAIPWFVPRHHLRYRQNLFERNLDDQRITQ